MHCRKMFAYDTKVVNEQACRDHAIMLVIREGEERVEIHKHKEGERCAGSCGPNVVTLQNTQQLLTLPEEQCYAFTKDMDVVSGR